MKRILTVALLILSLGLSALAQDSARLLNVKKIYLEDLGKDESSALVKEKIRLRLMKTNRFVVVDSPEEADAILTGIAGTTKGHYGSVSTNPVTGGVQGSGGTTHTGMGVVRLVVTPGRTTIWGFEYKPGYFGARSASSRVADKIVEQLVKDTKEAEKKAKK